MRTPYYFSRNNAASPLAAVGTFNLAEISTYDLASISCFLVDGNSASEAMDNIGAIRQHDNPLIYLKPIVLIGNMNTLIKTVEENVDHSASVEQFSREYLDNLSASFEAINQWIDAIPDVATVSDSSSRFKTLRLMASRDLKITPYYTVEHHNGFNYPKLKPLFAKKDNSIERTLEFLEQQQLITAKLKRRAHFCPHCDCAFLNFKETCPDCQSDNIETDELIHHFKCGHTDSAAKFKHFNKMQCPKCDNDLKHIGVDYDKPSTFHECNECSHTFQDPRVLADCYNCHRTMEPDNLDLRDINEYEVSALGKNAAIFGLDALFTSILSTDLNLYAQDEFKNFLAVERSRIKRYKLSQSSIALIHLGNLESLFETLGKKAEQVFKELSVVFKSVFRESDVISARNESVFCVLMTETSETNANLAISRLSASVDDLFKTNSNIDLLISSAIYNVVEFDSLEDQLDLFLAEKSSL